MHNWPEDSMWRCFLLGTIPALGFAPSDMALKSFGGKNARSAVASTRTTWSGGLVDGTGDSPMNRPPRRWLWIAGWTGYGACAAALLVGVSWSWSHRAA